jgi:cytochrome c oxidase cbb3-type subunit 3
MAGHLIFAAAATAAVASLVTLQPAVLAATGDTPGSPAEHTLGANPGAANLTQQTAPSGANLLTVPLVTNIPGGLSVPEVKSPVESDPQAVERGKKYFTGFNCVGCHAANGAGGMAPSLSNRFFKFGDQPAQMYNVIAHGAPLGMPAWGTILPSSAIWDIIAYIQSISDAPKGEWGTTINAAEHMPAIEQVPAEFGNTDRPWQHTEPFSSGHKPTSANPTGGEPKDSKSQ